jgi:predicted small metal-binding protein
MIKALRCDCGYQACGDNEPALVRAAQRHAADVHRMEIPTEQILIALLRAELETPDDPFDGPE